MAAGNKWDQVHNRVHTQFVYITVGKFQKIDHWVDPRSGVF